MIDQLRREVEAAAALGPRAHALALSNLAFALSQGSVEHAAETLAKALSVASAEPDFEVELRLRAGELYVGMGVLPLATLALDACPPPADPFAVVKLEDLREDLVLGPSDDWNVRLARLTPKLFGRQRAPSKARVLWASQGEVTTAETFDKKGKPARGGPRCERIFGPVSSYVCSCGRYSGEDAAGVVCERCGVEVISSECRTWRHAHVELGAPVLHPWFFDKAAALLGLTSTALAEAIDRKGAAAFAGDLSRLGQGELVVEVLAVPPPGAPVPGGHSDHETLEKALGTLLSASKKARSLLSKEVNRAALRDAVTAWFSCF